MKTKEKSVWGCKECGNTTAKWMGSCPACKQWNTLVETRISTEAPRFESHKISKSKAMPISEITTKQFDRIPSGFGEFDRMIGGGIVQGSLTLLGGEPGIGKSTLLLQLSDSLARQGLTVLYVCGEESVEQTSLRARRLGIGGGSLYLLSETSYSHIKAQIDEVKPDILIIDSVQIVYKAELSSAPGSVVQVREIAMEAMHLAKSSGITTFLVGHVTKSGEIAGPKVLEHIVDTVLDFEGDKQQGYRLLRSSKNRFGPTDEIVIFQMGEAGLSELANPSALFLEERQREMTGSVIIPTLEGSRAILIEAQALVAASSFATSSRKSAGLDQNRLALLLAVLEKRMGYQLYNLDVFVSIAGGMKIIEPAIDLGVLISIASSFCNRPIDADTVVMGEVGLSGEVRNIPRIENRIKEAKQMGFTKCIVPKKSLKGVSKEVNKGIQLHGVDVVDEAVRALLS